MVKRKVKGRLVFHHKVGGKQVPIHNMFVQLWDLDLLDNDFLAKGFTDRDGNFLLEYDSSAAGDRFEGAPELVLRVLDRDYCYDSKGKPQSTWEVIASFEASKRTKVPLYNFSTLGIAYWEYGDERISREGAAFTPRVEVMDGKVPQSQRTGRTLEQLKVGLRHKIGYERDKLIANYREDRPSNKDIQAHYPKNETRLKGAAARSDAALCDLVLNGFNPCLLKKSAPNKYYVEFLWTGVQQDTTHFAPNTTAYFSIKAGKLTLDSISVQKRTPGSFTAHAVYREAKLYRAPKGGASAKDKNRWGRVKRLFRVNYFLFGEALTHLAETHLNAEQYVVPLRRNVHLSPIARLLQPHVYGTVAVNLAANEVLIGEKGLVISTSALVKESAEQAVRNAFAGYNWHNWRPRTPLPKGHRFAHIGQLYWEVLDTYVSEYFKQNLPAIKKHWFEIRRFSDDLVNHALPYRDQQEESYYDQGELNQKDSPHPTVAGVPVAVSPVTQSDKANAEGLANLKQLCKYLLYFTTFKHSWVNDSQYYMGGETEFATLGVSDDLTDLQVDEKTAVPPKEALEHPFLTYVLNFTEYGYIIRNEDDDMNPMLRKSLAKHRNKFDALKYDVRGIRSTINT